MAFSASLVRALAAASLLAGGYAGMTAAEASTPVLTWQGATSLHVLCVAGPATRADSRRLEAELCQTVRALAAEGAPIPVSLAAFGDPVVIQPGSATLLVHASVETDAGGRLMALSIRTFRPGGVETAQLFGAAPRAVRLTPSGPGGTPLRGAVAALLAETLPWRQGR